MNETAYALYESAENLGLLFVLEPFGKNLNFKIPYAKTFCDKSIDELDLSVRSQNGLKRAGVHTIEDLINCIMRESGLSSVRNLGRKSISEIKTTILVRGYEQLNDKEKLTFWHDFLESNLLSSKLVLGGSLNA